MQIGKFYKVREHVQDTWYNHLDVLLLGPPIGFGGGGEGIEGYV